MGPHVIIPLIYPWAVHEQLPLVFSQYLTKEHQAHISVLVCPGLEELGISCELGTPTPTKCDECRRSTSSIVKTILPSADIVPLLLETDFLERRLSYSYSTGASILSNVYKHFRLFAKDQVLQHDGAIIDLTDQISLYQLLYFSFRKALEDCRRLYGEISYAILFNGRFTPYRAFYDATRSYGITTIVHERGSIDGSYRIELNKTCDDVFTFFSLVSRLAASSKLSLRQASHLKNLLSSRESGENTGFLPFSGTECTTFNLPRNKPIVTLFTGSLEEKAAQNPSISMSSYQKIIRYLEILPDATEYHLLIRHHPNLGTIGCEKSASTFLLQFSKLLQESSINRHRYTIVNPEAKFSSYQIIRSSSIVFAPFTTLFLESLMLGTPTFTIAECFFSKCFDDIFTLDNHIKLHNQCGLDTLLNIPLPDQQYLESFLYYYLIDTSILFPALHIQNHFSPSISSYSDACHAVSLNKDSFSYLHRLAEGSMGLKSLVTSSDLHLQQPLS